MIVAYTFALGFVPAILGIISISMGAAALCGCCAKDESPNVVNSEGVVISLGESPSPNTSKPPPSCCYKFFCPPCAVGGHDGCGCRCGCGCGCG